MYMFSSSSDVDWMYSCVISLVYVLISGRDADNERDTIRKTVDHRSLRWYVGGIFIGAVLCRQLDFLL